MYKRDLQREIQRTEERDTKRADAWLKTQGITPETFTQMDAELLQAQRIAHNCLKHHALLLTAAEADTLNRFLNSMASKKARKRIRQARIHQVMNIGNRINRQLFRQLRQHKQHSTQAKK